MSGNLTQQSPSGHDGRDEAAFLVLRRAPRGWTAEGRASWRGGDDSDAAGTVDGGVFAAWHWDGRSLRVSNDPYGLWPVYACLERDRVILATSLDGALRAGAPAARDDDALAVLFRLGYLVGDDTPFRAIRRWPPAARLDLDGSEPRLVGGPSIAAPNALDRQAALDGYIALFGAAIRRRLPDEPYVHPLSGGRDSRHILFALVEAGAPPVATLTVRHQPPKPDEDARIAALVSSQLGLEHRLLDQPERRVPAELRKNELTDFATPGSHSWFMPLVDYLDGYEGVLFDGYAGDVLSMARYLDPEDLRLYRAGMVQELALRMLGGHRTAGGMFTRQARQRYGIERARARLETELHLHLEAPNPVRSFRFWNYSRRQIAAAPFGLFRPRRMRLPFLDPEVYAFLAGLPPEVIIPGGGHFHTDAISRAYPQYADLPYENADPAPAPDARRFRRNAGETLRWLLSRPPASELRRSYLIPRLSRCLLGGRYSASVDWLASGAIHATQLETLASPHAGEA